MQRLRAGTTDVGLALGSETMNIPEKAMASPCIPVQESDKPYSRFLAIYAAMCRWHTRPYGTTQRQIAAVCSSNSHGNSAISPYSQFRRTLTVDEVLATPPITHPMTLPMCAPLSDGAAAAILCTEQFLERIRADQRPCITVAASVIRSSTHRRLDEPNRHTSRLAAVQACESAGLGREDMDVAEVHEATAMGEIVVAEDLEFAPPGSRGPAAESGDFRIGGRIPIHPSGDRSTSTGLARAAGAK